MKPSLRRLADICVMSLSPPARLPQHESLRPLGPWLKQHLPTRRNTLRFLLPKKPVGNIYFDRDLIVYARAVSLANQWKETDPAYKPLFTTYQGTHLRPRLKDLFDTFAILDIWNFAQPDQCHFITEKHSAVGEKIPKAIHAKIENELFAAEDFEVAAKEKTLRLCAAGKFAINLRGLELLQAQPGESEETAWMRIKGKLGSGKELEQTILVPPSAVPASGGTLPLQFPPTPPPPGPTPPATINDAPTSIFGAGEAAVPPTPALHACGTPPKTPVNLLGEVEKWGISPATSLANVNINVSKMTGAQLTQLLKNLPDGVNYGLNLEKEAQ